MKIELNETELDLFKNLLECAIDSGRYYDDENEVLKAMFSKLETEESK